MLLALLGAIRLGSRRDAVFARSDNRKMMLNVMLVVALIAVAIPACEMIGCDMSMPGMMGIATHSGTTFGHPCDGAWVVSSSIVGVLPAEFFIILLALIAALVASMMAFSPRVEFQMARLVEANGPPPPLDPRGERFII